MRFPPAIALFCLAALGLSACGKQTPEPESPPQAQASPGASATPGAADELDAGADRMKKKAGDAMASVDNYLKEQNPQLRERFQKAAAKFTKDKEKWREKLQQKQKELAPQIEKLKTQLGKLDGKTRDQLSQELARLQDQSKDTNQKLTELEAAGYDGWKAFKNRLKEEETRDSGATPTPSPAK